MFSLPTFLNFPWSLSLPSLPSISLPANIQRRFLSFVLKRFLGRFIKGNGLDVERIQAQIGEGKVDIEGLEVDTDEINALIPPSLPLTITSGTLSKVSARLPFPNLWSAPLSICLDELSIELLLSSSNASQPSSTGKGRQSDRPGLCLRSLSDPLDLASSVTSAADEFLHEELDAYEEAELDRSIRQSIIFSQTDPFNNTADDLPGAFPGTPFTASTSPGSPLPANVESTTVLAGLVERVLARLEVKVSKIKVRIVHDDPKFGGVMELRIGEIRYADQSAPQPVEGDKVSTVRAVRISQVDIYMLPSPHPSPPQRRFPVTPTRNYSSDSTVSANSSDCASSGDEGNDDLMMSMAVADLRQSVATTVSSDASVYASALTEAPMEQSRAQDTSSTRSSTPTPPLTKRCLPLRANATAAATDGERLILSFGSEDVILRMTTSHPRHSPHDTPNSQQDPVANRSPSTKSPAVEFDLSIGVVASVLLPSHMGVLLSALQALTKTPPSEKSSSTNGPSHDIQSAGSIANLRVNAVHWVIVYDLGAEKDPAYNAKLQQYWSKPSSTDLPVGHLKFRLDTFSASYTVNHLAFDKTSQRPERSRLPTQKTSGKGKISSVLSVTVLDASIFEFLSAIPSHDEDCPPGGLFPVLIFDKNLPRQYDHSLPMSAEGGIPVLPEFEGVDWRNAVLQRRGQGGEQAWKVKPRNRGVLKGGPSTSMERAEPVFTASIDTSFTSPAKIKVQPIHVFLDLSLLERLLPVLRHISPAMKRTETPSYQTSRPVTRLQKSESYVLDDLTAQATSPTTPDPRVAVVMCALIRISIRCPAPVNRRGTWGDGAHLRSGIVSLDIHDLEAGMSSSSGPRAKKVGSRSGNVQEGTNIAWKQMFLFFSRVPSTKSSAFLVVGPLRPDPGDADTTVLLPSINIASTMSHSSELKISVVTCRIPSVQAQIRQSTIEGLQFFVDDLTHWLDGAFGDGSRPKPRDELKMIGSRFFGSKGSSSASSSVFDYKEDDPTSATIIRIEITETDVLLHVPRSTQGDHAAPERLLSLKASDLSTELRLNAAGRQETVVDVTIMDIDFSDITTSPHRILGRTVPLTLTAKNHPIFRLRFSSLADKATDTKESDIKTTLSSFTFFVTDELAWINDLKAFAKTPEGVFEDVVPSEITRIALDIYDGSIHLVPPTLPAALVIVLGYVDIRTDVISNAEEELVDIGLSNLVMLAVDDVSSTATLVPSSAGCAELWKTAGYAQLMDLGEFDARICRDLVELGRVDVDVSSMRVRFTACADSLAMLGPILGDLANLVPSKGQSKDPVRSPMTLDQTINVFASIDQDAFNRIPDMISGADLIEDDLPTNLDYLDHATRRVEASTDKSTGETLRSWQTAEEGEVDARLYSEVNGETIKVFETEVFDMQEDYWDTLSPMSPSERDESKSAKIRLKLQDCTVQVLLYDGYDWQRTRKAIEDEIKTVRKRLEKIKQLLASGQQADESVENTRSVLFNSIYIGVDQSRDMDQAALLAAIDEELGDLGNDTSSISSWQTDFPAGHAGVPVGSDKRSKKARLKGKRLTRSKKPQIEFSLQGIKTEVEKFASDNETAMRVNVTIGSMEILDHIKTSTWKKFLTEMKADSRGNVRETDADMVRVELTSVRPSLPRLDEEYRLKAKILPLRLHVDQDALDFLKRFFSFSGLNNDAAISRSPPKSESAEPFFQHVEIFPIELKLDYKPKRVDFAALREGKTIELMNFFHFDGAEMTLRHITLSGISGITRLSTTLQDIWTPDVKANQLADVISGVSPIRSIVNVGSGVADLILLPIEQYRKDGRVARGVQRGTNSFVKSTALEMMKLGAKLATGTQVVLEKAEGVLGGKIGDREIVGEVSWRPSNSEADFSSEDETEVVSRYANQPTGAREGVQAAYQSLSKNVNAAAQTILAVPMEVYERSGDNGPLKAVVRAVPIAVLKPMIGASEAVSKTLLGMRNSLDPAGREELGDKYK